MAHQGEGALCHLPDDHKAFDWRGRMPVQHFLALLDALQRATRVPEIGLHYGQLYTFGHVGALDFAVLHASRLKESLSLLECYQRLVWNIPLIHIHYGTKNSSIALNSEEDPEEIAEFTSFAMALTLRLLRHFAGSEFRPVDVEMRRMAPKHIELYERLFGCHINFGSALDQIHFESSALDASNASADPRLYRLLLTLCEQQAAGLVESISLSERVKQHILVALPESPALLTDVARKFAMSERSLQRRLAEAGTSFDYIRDEARKTLSDRLLLSSGVSISEISYRCGYSNVSAYSRAAREWYGISPAGWRRRELSRRNLAQGARAI
jgi:AraC-like DNA-binding protein